MEILGAVVVATLIVYCIAGIIPAAVIFIGGLFVFALNIILNKYF